MKEEEIVNEILVLPEKIRDMEKELIYVKMQNQDDKETIKKLIQRETDNIYKEMRETRNKQLRHDSARNIELYSRLEKKEEYIVAKKNLDETTTRLEIMQVDINYLKARFQSLRDYRKFKSFNKYKSD